jgi:hypothetical protein
VRSRVDVNRSTHQMCSARTGPRTGHSDAPIALALIQPLLRRQVRLPRRDPRRVCPSTDRSRRHRFRDRRTKDDIGIPATEVRPRGVRNIEAAALLATTRRHRRRRTARPLNGADPLARPLPQRRHRVHRARRLAEAASGSDPARQRRQARRGAGDNGRRTRTVVRCRAQELVNKSTPNLQLPTPKESGGERRSKLQPPADPKCAPWELEVGRWELTYSFPHFQGLSNNLLVFWN